MILPLRPSVEVVLASIGAADSGSSSSGSKGWCSSALFRSRESLDIMRGERNRVVGDEKQGVKHERDQEYRRTAVGQVVDPSP